MTAMNLTITLADARTHLSALATAEPERIGNDVDSVGCAYFKVEGLALIPVCIVGQMFADLGILRFLKEDFNSTNSEAQMGACVFGSAVWDLLADRGVHVEDEAQKFMHAVQVQQDNSMAWGEAYRLGVQSYRKQAHRNLTEQMDRDLGFGVEPLAEWERELLEG